MPDRPTARLAAPLFLLLLAGVAGRPARAEPAAPTPATNAPVTILPPLVVAADVLRENPLFPKAEVTSPDFGPHEAPIDLHYPGQAYNDGVTSGFATVGVELDAAGRPTDYLLLRYSRKYFGEALLRAAQAQVYRPRQVKGVAVPGRFNFGTHFAPQFVMQLNSFNAIEQRNEEIEGGPKAVYEPHLEKELDGGGLVAVASAVALLPDGFTAPVGKRVKAIVSFYVDESGRVRLPNVESAASPLLIPNALKAVAHWSFEPPKMMGKPVLVFTLWSVTFVPPAAVWPAASP